MHLRPHLERRARVTGPLSDMSVRPRDGGGECNVARLDIGGRGAGAGVGVGIWKTNGFEKGKECTEYFQGVETERFQRGIEVMCSRCCVQGDVLKLMC